MVLKVIEVLSDSKVSWEDAAQQAVKQAAKTLKNIRSIYIKDLSAKVDKGKIVEYRVTAQITFALSNKE
jgi:dodecin